MPHGSNEAQQKSFIMSNVSSCSVQCLLTGTVTLEFCQKDVLMLYNKLHHSHVK